MKLYRNEYVLKNGQKLIVRIPEIGDEEGLIFPTPVGLRFRNVGNTKRYTEFRTKL